MELRIFISEIVKKWQEFNYATNNSVGLSGPSSHIIGEKGENYALKKLKKYFPDYDFIKTAGSKSPADIIGLKKGRKYWHFALYQVKTSLYNSKLSENIPEKETLPLLAKIIKENFKTSKQTKRVRNRPLLITIGYVGIQSTKTKNGYRNKIIKSVPYSKTFTLNKFNSLQLSKTEIKNKLHKFY